MTDKRDENGRFTFGNPGGPGRPRRAIESQYLAALSDALPLDEWRAIVSRAVQDAKDGDAKAREWIARYALGAEPLTLGRLAAREALGIDADDEVNAAARLLRDGPPLVSNWGGSGDAMTDYALQALADRQLEADRQRRREARSARKTAAADGAEKPASGAE